MDSKILLSIIAVASLVGASVFVVGPFGVEDPDADESVVTSPEGSAKPADVPGDSLAPVTTPEPVDDPDDFLAPVTTPEPPKTPVVSEPEVVPSEPLYSGYVITPQANPASRVTVINDYAFVKIGTVDHVTIVSGPASQSSNVSWSVTLSSSETVHDALEESVSRCVDEGTGINGFGATLDVVGFNVSFDNGSVTNTTMNKWSAGHYASLSKSISFGGSDPAPVNGNWHRYSLQADYDLYEVIRVTDVDLDYDIEYVLSINAMYVELQASESRAFPYSVAECRIDLDETQVKSILRNWSASDFATAKFYDNNILVGSVSVFKGGVVTLLEVAPAYGYGFSGWRANGTVTPAGASYLLWENTSFEAVYYKTWEDYTKVYTANDLTTALQKGSGKVVLMTDIDYRGTGLNVSTFSGVLEGNFHAISNMKNSRAIFTTLKGEIHDLTLQSCTMNASVSTTSGSYALVATTNSGVISGLCLKGCTVYVYDGINDNLDIDVSGICSRNTGTIYGASLEGTNVTFKAYTKETLTKKNPFSSESEFHMGVKVAGITVSNAGCVTNCHVSGSRIGGDTVHEYNRAPAWEIVMPGWKYAPRADVSVALICINNGGTATGCTGGTEQISVSHDPGSYGNLYGGAPLRDNLHTKSGRVL